MDLDDKVVDLEKEIERAKATRNDDLVKLLVELQRRREWSHHCIPIIRGRAGAGYGCGVMVFRTSHTDVFKIVWDDGRWDEIRIESIDISPIGPVI